jgi:hypothetical protein
MNFNSDSLFEDINDERELKSTQQEESENSKTKNSNAVKAFQTHENENVEISITTKLRILNKTVKCHVYDAKKHEKFMTWWKTIKWFYNDEKKFVKQRQKICWDFDKKSRHWQQYCEKATVTKKTSKVICLRCFIVFTHFDMNVENTIMINHLSSIKCVKIFTNKNLKRITKSLNYRASIKKLS